MAYIFGFICADGNIVHTKRGTWFWSIQVTDSEIVEKIKQACGSSHKINIKEAVGNNKAKYRIQIGSKEMCKDLISLGVTERKSKIIVFPVVPSEYFAHFLRGYFDGDGGVWVGQKNKRLSTRKTIISAYFTSGSLEFLTTLKILLKNKGLQGGSLVKKARGYELKYSVKDSLILYKIMYNSIESGLFLNRKKDKFDKYINTRA